jgi:hypothetical protein
MSDDKMGSRASAARQQSDTNLNNSGQTLGRKETNQTSGSTNNQTVAPSVTQTPNQFIQQHVAAAKAHPFGMSGKNQSQLEDSPTASAVAASSIPVASHQLQNRGSKERGGPGLRKQAATKSSLQSQLPPTTTTSPTSSINTGHTPLITSPGGTSQPIKLSMSSLTEAATTGRSVLLVQKEADNKNEPDQRQS